MGCLKLLKFTWLPFRKTRRPVSLQLAPLGDDRYIESEVRERPEDSEEKISLSTSAECIGLTVQSILTNAGVSVTAENLNILIAKSTAYLKEDFSYITDSRNYDFLVISTESDRHSAAEAAAMLSLKCDLVGAVFLDCIPIGAGLFESFESLCEASTKVILYVTEDFTRDDFCSRIVSLVYLHRRSDLLRKILPFLDKDSLNIELPRCLQLVDKLWLGSKLQIDLKWPKIWTRGLRNQRLNRDRESLLKSDAFRKEMLSEFLYHELGIILRRNDNFSVY